MVHEEYLPGVRAVAVTLGNQRGPPLAVWVVGFISSLFDERLNNVVDLTLKGAQALRQKLDV